MNNHELHKQAQQLEDIKTPYQLSKELILLREECDQLKAVIVAVCDKCTETGNGEIFHIAASKNVSLNKIKSDAVRDAANETIVHRISGFCLHCELIAYANKLEGFEL